MTTLIVGATGATGRLVVSHLLNSGEAVKAIVRTRDSLPSELAHHPHLTLIEASVLDLSDQEMTRHVQGCRAVISCLGHNLTFKGVYGSPQMLVTQATHRLCAAIMANAPDHPVKFVLMNTTGNRNRDLEEPISIAQKCVLALLRALLPPHLDNERAAEYLRAEIGHAHPMVEWVAMRPDGLVNISEVTAYDIHPSPIRSAIFDAGTTSRINAADFMAKLVQDDTLWHRWRGQMPVIYNQE